MLTSAKRLCGVGMIVAGVCMVSSGSAFAGLDIPDFTMTWWASGDGQDPETFDPADFGNVINHGDGLFEYLGGRSHDLWTLDWDALVDPDPFIDGQIVVTNNDSEFQTFFLLMTLNGITPVEEPSVMNGEVAATVTNNQLTGDATPTSTSSTSRATRPSRRCGSTTTTSSRPAAWPPNRMTWPSGRKPGPPRTTTSRSSSALSFRPETRHRSPAFSTSFPRLRPCPRWLSSASLVGAGDAARRDRHPRERGSCRARCVGLTPALRGASQVDASVCPDAATDSGARSWSGGGTWSASNSISMSDKISITPVGNRRMRLHSVLDAGIRLYEEFRGRMRLADYPRRESRSRLISPSGHGEFVESRRERRRRR
jgi:hypothetical protein